MSNKPFAIADVPTGILNALAKTIMRQTGQTDAGKAINLVTSGEYLVKKPQREWREEGGIIYLEVTSDGTTGQNWVRRLKRQGGGLHDEASKMLCSHLKPTRGVTYKVAILKCEATSTFREIRTRAETLQLKKPSMEVACLIREKTSDWEIQAMGISWIHVMHEAVPSLNLKAILSVYSSWEYENYIWVQPEQVDTEEVTTDIGFAYIVA